jgi:hypothetical protein
MEKWFGDSKNGETEGEMGMKNKEGKEKIGGGRTIEGRIKKGEKGEKGLGNGRKELERCNATTGEG